jgi:signal transduction histidine kinase
LQRLRGELGDEEADTTFARGRLEEDPEGDRVRVSSPVTPRGEESHWITSGATKAAPRWEVLQEGIVRGAAHDGARHGAERVGGHRAVRVVVNSASSAAAGLVEAAQNVPGGLHRGVNSGSHEELFVKVMFVKLAGRLQSFISRALAEIEQLEATYEDPELLAALYRLDHLFTLVRRQAENLAVLGGQSPDRRSADPVEIHEVLINANAEIERFKQVSIVPVNIPGSSDPLVPDIHGLVAAEVIHLLAELLDNATYFTPPDGPKVEVRANRVAAGLAVEISDRGVGMDFDEQERINRVLDGSERIDMIQRVQEGRTGLAVVRELAARHDIKVELKRNIFGGVVAAVVLPPALLVELHSPPHPAPQSPRVEPGVVASAAEYQSERALPAAVTDMRGLTAPPGPPAPTLTSPRRRRDGDGVSAPMVTTRTPASHDVPGDWNAFGGEPAGASSVSGHLMPQLPTRQTRRDRSEARVSEPVPGPGPATEGFPPVPPVSPSQVGAADPDMPPALPVRGSGTSYMPPELAKPVDAPAVLPGHRVDLYAQVRAGRQAAPWPPQEEAEVGEGDVAEDFGAGPDVGSEVQPAPGYVNDHTQNYMTRGEQTRWTT